MPKTDTTVFMLELRRTDDWEGNYCPLCHSAAPFKTTTTLPPSGTAFPNLANARSLDVSYRLHRRAYSHISVSFDLQHGQRRAHGLTLVRAVALRGDAQSAGISKVGNHR